MWTLSFCIFAVGLFDFAKTGSFDVALAEGQSLFSRSGLFLTGTDLGDELPEVIPVPASFPLLLGALWLTAIELRRRRSRPQAA